MPISPRKVFAITLTLVFALAVLGYALYQARAIIAGPRIVVETPSPGAIATTSLVTVRGTIKNAKETTLDGRPIFVDLDGNFEEKLLLMEGYNTIELTAKDVSGRMERRVLELTYHPE